jgi:hypothetical protein
MASTGSVEDLGFWIDEVRNHKTADQTPILFIDEADSRAQDVPVFLPLLYDGEFYWKGRTLKTGRCIFILGASSRRLRRLIESGPPEDSTDEDNAECQQEQPHDDGGFDKYPDLLSRINGGVIKLSSIDQRKCDKLCIALALIQKRFGEPNVHEVNMAFIRLLVDTTFSYSVRSMETLIQQFPDPDQDGFLDTTQKFNDQVVDRILARDGFHSNMLAFHMNSSECPQATATWERFSRRKAKVRFAEAAKKTR